MFEVEGWVVLLLFGIVAYALSKKADKPGTQVSKKKNFKKQLSEQIYFMPEQRNFNLSDYGRDLVDAVKSYSEKLAADGNFKNGWKDLTMTEREAYILAHFDIIQQFLNPVNEHFIIELKDETVGTLATFADSPYTAVVLQIYRGKEEIGEIEIDPEIFDDYPTATVRCRLKYAEMFDYEAVYSLFYKVASIHLDQDDPQATQNLHLQITKYLTHFLWDRLNSSAEADYDGFDWHKFEPLQMEFEGQFKNYKDFRSKVLDKEANRDLFKYEAKHIQNLMDHFGMEEIEKK